MKTLARFKWAILLAILGFALQLGPAILVLTTMSQAGESFAGPGAADVNITSPGAYTLWLQNQLFVDGHLATAPLDLPPGTIIKVSRPSDGATIPLSDPGTISMGTGEGMHRIGVGSLTFDAPGLYRIDVGPMSSPRFFHLGKDFLRQYLRLFLAAIAMSVAGTVMIGAAVVIALLTLVRIINKPKASTAAGPAAP
ncbi:MAG: hypothetical protein NTW19_12860 [Planctomycetota bacterium]|nr:hypothetical protein [Planctomycetota bacterium]